MPSEPFCSMSAPLLPYYIITGRPAPSVEVVRRAAEMTEMALAEAGYPPQVIGRDDQGQTICRPVPIPVLRRAQQLVAAHFGWGLRERGGAGMTTERTDSDG